MALLTDENGIFIQGMTDPNELRNFINQKFTEFELQNAYVSLLEKSKILAKGERITPLQALWKILERSYDDNAPPLTCSKGCSHCCYTGVSTTQLEWDAMLDSAKKNGLDLNAVMERSEKSIDRVRQTLAKKKDPDQIAWHNIVVNQPCPFLDEDESCSIHEDRPLDCRLMVAFREVCSSKKLEHAQRGVTIEEAVAPTVIARLQYEQTPKIKRRKFDGTQKLRLIQHWLIMWKDKKSSKRKKG